MKYYVTMKDRFMSGWGRAEGKENILCIQCETLDQAKQIEQAAHKNSDMSGIKIRQSAPQEERGQFWSYKHYTDMSGSWIEDGGRL